MGLVQEKFQVEFPDRKDDHEWKTPKSARRTAMAPTERASEASYSGGLNCLPPGDLIEDQELASTRTPTKVMADQTDVTPQWAAESSTKGFTRYNLRPTDDSYTAEHTDTFYGEAVSDGETGFAERGNMLDRI